MGALESLIQIKRMAKSDDVVQLLDEVATYEKLAKVEAFRDLKTSEAARKKLPILAKAYDSDLYAVMLSDIASNILRHLEDEVPAVLEGLELVMNEKDVKRLEMMRSAIAQVTYRHVREYDHETMKGDIVAVFESSVELTNKVIILVKTNGKYTVYQGSYSEEEKKKAERKKAEPYVMERDGTRLSVMTYSIMGNNAYPFAVYEGEGGAFDVKMPDEGTISLASKTSNEARVHYMTKDEKNELTMAKSSVDKFANTLLEIINGGGAA